jgi:hypothetical protein
MKCISPREYNLASAGISGHEVSHLKGKFRSSQKLKRYLFTNHIWRAKMTPSPSPPTSPILSLPSRQLFQPLTTKDNLIERNSTMKSSVKQVYHERKDDNAPPRPLGKRRPKPQRFPGEISEEDQLNMQSDRMEEVPNITVQEMAATNPDFLGKCMYLNMRMDQVRLPGIQNGKSLTNQQNMREVPGTYLIVYTRPVCACSGSLSDPRVQTFTPSTDRQIQVAYRLPPDSTIAQRDRFISVEGRPFALATAHINDHIFRMELYKPGFSGELRTVTTCIQTSDSDAQDRLDEILMYQELMEGETNVTFGFKVVGLEWHGAEQIPLGFQFMRIDLSCTNPETGKEGFQTIIAVRMPDNRRWPSTLYVLRQRLPQPIHPSRCEIVHDTSFEDEEEKMGEPMVLSDEKEEQGKGEMEDDWRTDGSDYSGEGYGCDESSDRDHSDSDRSEVTVRDAPWEVE